MKIDLEDGDEVWINNSKSGKGIFLPVSDELFLVGNKNQMERFANGKIKAMPLTVMINDDED